MRLDAYADLDAAIEKMRVRRQLRQLYVITTIQGLAVIVLGIAVILR